MARKQARPEVAGLFVAHHRSVYRRALNLLGDQDAAKDVCQEIFVRVMRLEDPAPLAANPLAWLYRATTNLCLNQLRDSKRRQELLSSWPSEEQHTGSADARVIVYRILRDVPEDLQEAAVYYYVDELSHEEIAQIIGTSRRTVGNRLLSFHARVGELLQEKVLS
ncbi:MAG TPA: RNA polymerase sigma factor [Polyangiaceae bacterium]|nr:RNA polymerase sigma factor [Polyangiaceae bacterium]